MITMVIGAGNGTKLLVIGLSDEDVADLRLGSAVPLNVHALGAGPFAKAMVVYEKTNDLIDDKIREVFLKVGGLPQHIRNANDE